MHGCLEVGEPHDAKRDGATEDHNYSSKGE
jgi:hypothetical protein